ncbi:MAG: thiol reductant ABC exporter subunit CydC [Rectinemataceae bacterium]|jgi:ATP-binding cassette subfamily C protein CydC
MNGLLRLARLILPHWRRVALGALLTFVTLLANIGLLALSSWFIASMAIAGTLGMVMDYTLPATGIRALAIVRAVGRYVERLVNHDTTFRILTSLRLWFFRRIEPLAPARLSGFRSGDLLARIRADIDTLDDYYVRGIIPAIVAALAGACIVPFLARFDPRIAWIDGLALLAAGLVIPMALAALASRPGRERVLRSAELRSSIVEEVEGMAELVAMGAAPSHARRMDDVSARLDARQRRLNSLLGIGDAAIVAAGSLAVLGAAFILVGRIGEGGLPRVDMAMLTVFVLASFETILPLPAAIQKAGEMAAAARRLYEIIDSAPAVTAPASGELGHATAPVPAPVPARMEVDLSVRDLRFRYAPELPFVFDGFSLDLPSGSKIALVGPSGAGKSSFVNLLLRFWDYESGRIELDGRDLRTFDPDEARRFFSVVPQLPFLFHGSIRENLLLAALPDGGLPDAAVEERLLEAIDAAQLSVLVGSLPDGLDTIVGETGRAVSVGEARRIAVARAFLKEAPIYVFDEPTEGLDDRGADALLGAIAERLAKRTLIMISHRERDLAIVDGVYSLMALAAASADEKAAWRL